MMRACDWVLAAVARYFDAAVAVRYHIRGGLYRRGRLPEAANNPGAERKFAPQERIGQPREVAETVAFQWLLVARLRC